MKLQLLVPQYHETDAEVKPLLDSVAIQQGIDMSEVGVVIVNDGSDIKLTQDFLDSYPFKIEYYDAPHQGVSATRNECLDHATAEYVMFCDADDMFYNACGMWILFREFQIGNFDSLISVFVEELKDRNTGQLTYVNHDMDLTFVHGKVYRRQYLIDNHIRFNPALTIHEDSYFNCLAQKCGNTPKYCQTPFYLWKWRDTSVCRHDPKYILKTYNNMLESSTALVNEFLRRSRKGDARYFATGMIYDSYFTMNKKEWIDQENKQYRDATEKRFQKYYHDFKDLFDEVPEAEKTQIVSGIRNRMYQEGLLMESITFDDWIKHIETL